MKFTCSPSATCYGMWQWKVQIPGLSVVYWNTICPLGGIAAVSRLTGFSRFSVPFQRPFPSDRMNISWPWICMACMFCAMVGFSTCTLIVLFVPILYNCADYSNLALFKNRPIMECDSSVSYLRFRVMWLHHSCAQLTASVGYNCLWRCRGNSS